MPVTINNLFTIDTGFRQCDKAGEKTMKQILTLIAFSIISLSANAQEIDYQSIDAAGYGDVSALLQGMSPDQRNGILEAAKEQEAQLRKMSPTELAALEQQMKTAYSSIDMSKVDPSKLDVAKAKPIGGVMQDFKTFNGMKREDLKKKPSGGLIR
jgi:hypothetical protein